MTVETKRPSSPTLVLVEPTDGSTDLAGRLETAGLRFTRHERIPADAEGREPQDTAIVIAASRSLPKDGVPALRAALGVGPQVPVLIVAEPGASADARTDGPNATVALVAWPVSASALRALVSGLGLDAGGAGGRVRARAPEGGAPAALYTEVVAAADAAFVAARDGRAPDLPAIRLLAERIHSQLLRDNALVLRSLEPHGEYDLASHSTNVAIIAGKIGLGMALGIEDVVRVILAGIVHDIGMARLPEDLVRKPGRLTQAERERLREHPVLGAELLADVESRYTWLEPVVLQEHERMHGQGYPAGLVGSAIDPLAQVIGLADVFEALSHPRAYRSPYTALEALEQVSEMKGEYFEAGVVAALINEISAFPLDSYVQLSTGAIAQVVGTNPDNILRPEVLVRWDADWSLIDPPRRLDLAEAPDVTVARALLEAELPIT